MIVAGALSILPIGSFVLQKQKVNLICENFVLEAQEHLVEGETKLLQLNPQVRALVLQKKTLERAMRLAPTPILKAAIAAKLAIVLAQIGILRTQQILIFKTQEIKALKSMLLLRKNLRSQLNKFEKAWGAPPLVPLINSTPPKIKLIEVKVDPTIPIYEAPPNLSVLQTLEVEILVRGERIFPRWIKFLRTQKIFWQESCSSHPQKGIVQWQSHLGKGKFF